MLFAAKRVRQINAYYAQLGEGLLESVGPLVETQPQEKPLSIALREIQAAQLQYTEIDLAPRQWHRRYNSQPFRPSVLAHADAHRPGLRYPCLLPD